VVAGPVDPDDVRTALSALDLAGRFELVAGKPPLVLDAAHNPDGARALAEALGEHVGGRPVVACLAILADKDARGIVAALAPALAAVVCTEIPAARLAGSGRPGITAVPAAELVLLCEVAAVPATAHTDPEGAVALAKAMAGERGGVALIAGSHYLLQYAHG
jgi:dihydrofolate synthase/folylpolyglutamate synthase